MKNEGLKWVGKREFTMIVHVHTQAHTEREIGVYWYTHTHAHKHFCTNTLTRCERGTQGLGFRLRVYINTHTLYLYLSLSHSTHLCRLNTPTVERLTALVQLWETGDKLAFNSAIIHGHDLLRMPPEKWPELREIRPKGWWVTCIGETLLKPCAGCKNLYDTQALDKDSSHCANCRCKSPQRHACQETPALKLLFRTIIRGPLFNRAPAKTQTNESTYPGRDGHST